MTFKVMEGSRGATCRSRPDDWTPTDPALCDNGFCVNASVLGRRIAPLFGSLVAESGFSHSVEWVLLEIPVARQWVVRG